MRPEGPLAAIIASAGTPDFPDIQSGQRWRHEVAVDGKLLIADIPPQGDDGLAQSLFDLLGRRDFGQLARIDTRFAAIFIDDDDVLLVRDWIGSRPLHYRADAGQLAVATMAQDLRQSGDRVDWHWLARRAAMQSRASDGTATSEIKRVLPGHVLRWSRRDGRIETTRYWQPKRTPLDLDFTSAVAEADRLFSDAMDRATRGAKAPLATQLTGGLDSSLVVSHAAERTAITAITGTYRGDTVDPGEGYFLDEASRAAQTAKALGIGHHIVEADDTPLLDQIDAWQAQLGEPIANADNLSWLDPLYQHVQEQGAERLLTGALGNFTLSWPGSGALAELLRRGHIRTWWRSANAQRANLGASWKGVVALSLPWLRPSENEQVRFIGGPDGYWQVPQDRRDVRANILLHHDPGPWHEAVRRRFGIDEVDCFADRALVEFSLRLRESHCYQPGEPRALMRAVLRGRVSEDVIDEHKRGLQGADWPQRLAVAAPHIAAQLEEGPVPLPFDHAALRDAARHFDPASASTERETEMRFDFTRAVAALRLGRSLS